MKNRNKLPLVSIIVPVYKAEAYVATCIESIQAQTCTDWELILVDDGSPDNSGQICDNYAFGDERITVIHKMNGGVSAARNDALKIAKGKYLSFVDSDDYVLPLYLSDMLACEADVVVTGYINRYEPQTRKEHYRPIAGDRFYSVENRNLADGLSDIEMDYRWLGPAAKLYLRDIVNKHNILFDESLDYGEDHLFNMEFGKHVKSIAFLNRYNYIYMHRNVFSLTNRQIDSEIMFKYITKLYIIRKVYIDTICFGNKQYQKFVCSELSSYYWRTLFTLLTEQKKTNKNKCELIRLVVRKLPRSVLYDKQYQLSVTYRIVRYVYTVLPINVATFILGIFHRK